MAASQQNAPSRAMVSPQQQAVIDSYFDVCNTIRRVLQTHLGAQQTLNHHRQMVIALQESLAAHRNLFDPDDVTTMQRGINEMLEHLSNARYALSDPLPDDHQIQVIEIVRNGGRGRPRVQLAREFLNEALTLRGPSGIALLLPISARTIRRRILEHGIRPPGNPVYVTSLDENGEPSRRYTPHNPALRLTPITNQRLDLMLREGLTSFPELGRSLSLGYFASRGVRVSKERLRLAYIRVQGGPAIVGHRSVQRREYYVVGPNSLWHHDGQHGLIMWKIVVHMFIDGKSRLITGAQASNNNLSDTVLELFLQAISIHGRPSRVRGDYGVENVGVAANQETARGRGTYIWGRSVHNTRIERAWVDYSDGVGRKWSTLFRELEAHHGLNPELNAHLWLLHQIYLPMINYDLATWVELWNNHPMQLPHGQRNGPSPRAQFFFGMLEHGPRGFDTFDVNEEAGEGGMVDGAQELGAAEQGRVGRPFGGTRPERLHHVDVEPPQVDVEARVLEELLRRLGAVVDLQSADMDVRTHAWIQGLSIAEELEEHGF